MTRAATRLDHVRIRDGDPVEVVAELPVELDRVGAVHLSGGLGVRRHDRGTVGSAMPIERVQGLDFALTALFVVLSIDAYRARPDRLSAAGALMCAVVAAVTVPEQMLMWAWSSVR
jgi:hypothetical protein